MVKSRLQTLPAAPVGARLRTLLTFSLAVAVALAVHLFVSKKEPALETRSYTVFLCAVLAIALLTAPAQVLWSSLRRWRQNMHPILAAVALLLCLWEIITSGLRLLPL
ncbi:MAG: ABC transporter permease, partial [Verrucomicrobia bacterium]